MIRLPRRHVALLFALLLALSPWARTGAPALPAVSAGAELATPTEDRDLRAVHARLSQRARGLSGAEVSAVAEVIVAASRRHELPPELVLAVIEVESAYDPYAVSHVGAMGLMQLLPSTAAEMAQRLDMPWQGSAMLFDPVANVRLGVAYLDQLVERYASVRVALAAYNWGPGRIDQRLREGDSLPALYSGRVLDTYSVRRAARS